jgi:hypothetical protein
VPKCHPDRYAYSDTNGHIHADANSDSHGDVHADTDCDCNIYAYRNSYSYCDSNSHGDGNRDCDHLAAAYTDAEAAADTAASSGQLLFR